MNIFEQICNKISYSHKSIYVLALFFIYSDIFSQTNDIIVPVKEVTVDGHKKYVDFKFDREIFYMNDSKISSANTIFDILKTIPGILVNNTNIVKYKGSPVVIYIDDQPSEYLYPNPEMIPIAYINKIEIVDAAFKSGSGKDGIINIRMKKNSAKGVNGMFSTRASSDFSDLNKGTVFGNLNHRSKKFTFFSTINFMYNMDHLRTFADGTLNYKSNDFSVKDSLIKKKSVNTPFVSSGFIFYPNDKTNILLVGNVLSSFGKEDQFFSYQSDNKKKPIYDEYKKKMTGDFSNMVTSVNASFNYKFNLLGKELTVGTGLQKYTQKENAKYLYDYNFLINKATDSTLNSLVQSQLDKYKLSCFAYYNHPLKYKLRWNAGLSSHAIFPHTNKDDVLVNDIKNVQLSKTEYSTSKDFTVFSRLGREMNDLVVDIGVAMQYQVNNFDFTRFQPDSTLKITGVNNNYINLLPSVTAVYSLDSAQQIKLTFDKGIVNPQMFQLFEHVDKFDQRNWSTGNSKLMEYDYNNFYLSYIHNQEKWNCSADIFYSQVNDDIANVVFPNSNTGTIIIPENFKRKSKIGIDVSVWIDIIKELEVNASFSVYQSTLNASNLKDIILALQLPAENIIKKEIGYLFKFNSNFKLSTSTFGMIYLNYFSPEISFEGSKYGYFNSSIGLTQKLYDKKISISIGVNNLFDDMLKHKYNINYFGLSQNINETGTFYKRMLFIKFQYSINQKEKSLKK